MTCSFASFLISSRIFGKKATELEIVTKFVSLSGRYLKEVFLLQIARKELSEYFFHCKGENGSGSRSNESIDEISGVLNFFNSQET